MRLDLIQTTVLLMAVLLFAGCGDDASPAGGSSNPDASASASPEATIQGMLTLAEAGKWQEYVTTYYGELHKLDKPDSQIATLATRFETVAPKLIETLRACVGESPKVSEDGTRAVYANQFTLHKRDGKWGFHL